MSKLQITALALLMAGSAALAQGGGPPPATVEVESARTDEVAATSWVPGTVVSRNDARVAAEISGRATWVAEVGTSVEAGEAIATIDDRMLQLRLKDSETGIARLRAQLDYEQSQVQRLARLAEQNNAAATQLDQARSQAEVMAQQLAAARIQREQIEYDLERSRVKAPFPGRVVERLAQPGEYFNPGTPVARLVDTGNREVRVQAPLSAARFVSEDMVVTVRDEYSEAQNPVRTVIPVGDERSRMIEIRVALDQPDWVIGGAVQVALPTSQSRSLVVIPRDALVLRGNETFVYRVLDDDTAEKVTIDTGIGVGAMVEVIGDIAPGDRLVVRGGERLRPGQSVQVVSRS